MSTPYNIGTLAVSGTLGVTGLTTATGGVTSPSNKGYVYSGTTTVSATSGSSTIAAGVINSKVGTATFTNININGVSSQVFTINNAAIGSNGIVNFSCNSTSAMVLSIGSVTWNSGVSLAVTILNTALLTATGASTFTISWFSFN